MASSAETVIIYTLYMIKTTKTMIGDKTRHAFEGFASLHAQMTSSMSRDDARNLTKQNRSAAVAVVSGLASVRARACHCRDPEETQLLERYVSSSLLVVKHWRILFLHRPFLLCPHTRLSLASRSAGDIGFTVSGNYLKCGRKESIC